MTPSPSVRNRERIQFDQLTSVIEASLLRAGASTNVARILAENCASCERDGALSHGVFRVPGYVASIRSGWADGSAAPRIERTASGFVKIDAANGFAQPALAAARDEIADALTSAGVAVIALKDSHHFSALWPDLEPFADAGAIGITMVTGGAAVIPRGAHAKVLGTNPLAFASPVAEHRPLVVDFATSTMSHGDLQLMANAGERVPLGTGTGIQGRDTDDPNEILDAGGLLPFGGHKGAALSIMIELLASGLTGGAFSYREDLTFAERSEDGGTARTGQLLILIDPARSISDYATRADEFISALRKFGLDRLPADQRYRARDDALARGIPVTAPIARLLAQEASR